LRLSFPKKDCRSALSVSSDGDKASCEERAHDAIDRCTIDEGYLAIPDHIAPPVAVAADPPPGWIDKTMIVYAAPPANGQTMAPTIVVGRDALAEGESFREFCNRQIDTFRAGLPEFYREHEEHGRVGDLDAFQIRFSWRAAAGLLRQRVFFISAGQGVIVTYAGTAAAEDYDAYDALFEQNLATLRIRPMQADTMS
jgi:hypothetical protein